MSGHIVVGVDGSDGADRALAFAIREARLSGVDLVAVHASAPVLLEAAEGADMLVIGTRGHGGFTGLLLGSTSQHCAHRPPCPLVIIP